MDEKRIPRRHAEVPSNLVLVSGIIVSLTLPVMAVDRSWNNPSGGTWGTAGDWTPAGVPQSADNAFIGDIPAVENETVVLDQNDTIAGLSITDGMELETDGFNLVVQGEALISGQNQISQNVFANSTLHVEGDGIGFDADIDTLTLEDRGRLRLSNDAVVQIDLVAWVSFLSGIAGSGTIELAGNTSPSLSVDGVIAPASDGLVINQNGTGLIDLDGDLGNSVLFVNSFLVGPSGAFGSDNMTINGTALTDPFSGELRLTTGGFLEMNLTDGWTADSSSDIFLQGKPGFTDPAIIRGADWMLNGHVDADSTNMRADIECNTTLGPSADIDIGIDDILRFTGEADITGGTYTLDDNAALRFTGDTTVRGGTFQTFGPAIADGEVRFDGPTLWVGAIHVDGLVRQDGSPRVGLESAVNGGVFDLDGSLGNTASWDFDAPMTLNVDAIDTSDNIYDGVLDLGDAFGSRLTVNLTDPAARWTMDGTCNLSGNAAFNLNRIAGSTPMDVTGEVNLTNSKAGILADTRFLGTSSMNFNSASSELTLGGVSQWSSSTSFTGDGLLINSSTGDMTLDDGLDMGPARVLNNGRLHIGDEELAAVTTGGFENRASGTFAVDVSCAGGVPMTDQLVVNGVATLNGTLELTHLNDFHAEPGDSFVIIDANSFSGVFSSFDFPPGWDWSVSYDVPSADVIVTLNNAPAQDVTSIASRRLHGSQTFDIEIPVSGAAIEPRQNGTQPQMVFTYNLPPIDPDCRGPSIVHATCLGTSVECNKLVIDMTFNKNACVEVTVGGDSVSILTHEGNVDNNAAVNILDLQQIKNRLIQFVDETNFIYDINTSGGAINILDLQATKNNLFVPAGCP